MSQIVDLTLTLEDNMPAHKLFQRPVVVPHRRVGRQDAARTLHG